MANWNQIFIEIQNEVNGGIPATVALDKVRRAYLTKLYDYTKRPTICYYSGWLQKPKIASAGIDDNDKNAFMATVHGLPKDQGLDLILHTPGGDTAATESLIYYLRKIFGTNIRAFVPQIAMSAGTVIACACKEIWMGKQSNIGPIDPQFNGIAAHGIIEEFDTALREVAANPRTAPVWTTIIAKYHPTFLADCKHAMDFTAQIVRTSLISGMFEGQADAAQKADLVVAKLNNHTETKAHNRHIHMDEAKEIGLKIMELEAENGLQDLILSVHHAYMHTLTATNQCKIIENHMGVAVATHVAASMLP